MSHATATSIALLGITGHLVAVHAEPAISGGLVVLGPDGRSMEEARDRVRAGTTNAGLALPAGGLTISLPSDSPRPGPGADLAMAASALAISGLIPTAGLDMAVLIGEVWIDGTVRPVRGVLPMVATAVDHLFGTVVLPAANAREAHLVRGIRTILVDSLQQLAQWASNGQQPPVRTPARPQPSTGDEYTVDLAHLRMRRPRWALEVAAAGGHNLGLIGPDGSDKALLARCLPPLLPDLDDDAAWEVALIRSAAGLEPPDSGLLRRPVLRAPYRCTSLSALLGGGPLAYRPGTVSLAHHGVLYLEDAPEFGTRAISALRGVVDARQVQLAGASRYTVTYPARFQLVLGAQPCPCIHPTSAEACTACTAQDRHRYMARMAELWQRTDIRLHLATTDPHDTVANESSATVAQRIMHARELAADRWAALGYQVNADVPGSVLRGVCRLPSHDIDPLLRLFRIGVISGDGHDRILRLAWTINDLRGGDRPDINDVNAAIDLHLDQQP